MAWTDGLCKTWFSCPNCNTYVHTYRPMPHQRAVHKDSHRNIGNFGGYGTGKTTTSREEILKHIFLTPDANILVGANVQSQYEQTIKRELEMDLPKAFVKDYSAQKQHMDFINGARIIWRPFDDPDKLRSYNVTMAVILEASEVKGEAFVQLKTRLRNLAATLPLRDEAGNIVFKTTRNGEKVPAIKYDWRKMIVESNPDSGWIRNEILLRSDRINQYEAYFDYLQDPARIDPATSSHVAASTVNAYLPEDVVAGWRRTNPAWWVKRYLEGSFQYSEGLVYPSALDHVVPTFQVPKNWKRGVAFDYGLNDTAAYVFLAVDEVKGMAYVYKESGATQRDVKALAQMYHIGVADIPSGGMFTNPIIDPKSGPKRDYNLRTLAEQFLDYNIVFQPGAVDVDARIYRLNTYIESGRLKIMDCCPNLIRELGDYKFPERKLGDNKKNYDKPEDKNNHYINDLEWLVMELPRDPRHLSLIAYGRNGEHLDMNPGFEEQPETMAPWQFAEEPERRTSTWF